MILHQLTQTERKIILDSTKKRKMYKGSIKMKMSLQIERFEGDQESFSSCCFIHLCAFKLYDVNKEKKG